MFFVLLLKLVLVLCHVNPQSFEIRRVQLSNKKNSLPILTLSEAEASNFWGVY